MGCVQGVLYDVTNDNTLCELQGSPTPGLDEGLALWGAGHQKRQTGWFYQCHPSSHQDIR